MRIESRSESSRALKKRPLRHEIDVDRASSGSVMGFEDYAKPVATSVDRYFDRFAKNHERGRRYLITSRTGQHLVGVPTTAAPFVPAPGATFLFATSQSTYQIPFSELAWAEELVDEPGLRPSDGSPPFPEPCRGPLEARAKSEKFGILDSPALLAGDMEEARGESGLVLLYLDVDGFKALNTRHTERKVDATILPELQRLVDGMTQCHGFSYAEGGDEIVVLLRNSTTLVGAAFAESLRSEIAARPFAVDDHIERVTASIGLVASSPTRPLAHLPTLANEAKRHAKASGKDCVCVWEEKGILKVADLRWDPLG